MTMSNLNSTVVAGQNNNLGDTTLTKVFVGGLAWETPKEAMREHFDKFGEILEAVIISNKLTGRSKGYGFVTFKDAEAAKKACEDATPMIHGRRANCNLASLGARRPRPPHSSTTPPPPQGPNVGPRGASTAPVNHVQWYYPAGAPPPPPPAAGIAAAPPFHPQNHRQAVPIYGYPPTYVATDMTYNHKVNYGGGAYMNGHFYHPGQAMMGANTLVPVYPFYQIHHQTQTLGLPAHLYSPTTPGPVPTVPALVSKPTSIAPTAAGTVVGNGEALKRVVKGN
nr:probable RNA-binding protein ARP1 isoform X1 [Ipomoea batatas]GME18314.1 probable RNA-binding protein ARP1 isoform X1 [Ipomoea batatas]